MLILGLLVTLTCLITEHVRLARDILQPGYMSEILGVLTWA